MRRCAPTRRGVAAVEFAIVVPIFVLLVFGLIELGRSFMVQQILTNASREGARRAIIEGSTTTEVKNLVGDYLGATSVSSGYTVTVSPNITPALGLGDPITVSVSVPYSAVSWMPSAWWMGGATMSATSTMRVERPQ